MNSIVQFGELLDFSPVDSSSVWEVGVTGEIETVIRNANQEVEADEKLPSWTSDTSAAPENYASTPRSKRTFGDILRGVKMREDTLQCAVARLGGGTRGLQLLMEHVKFWALKSRDDEDATATIRRGIVDLGMPPTPKRHRYSRISANSGAGNGGGPCFGTQASPPGACERVNQGAAYTRALRKSHMLHQRGQRRAHHSMRSRCGGLSTSRECRSQVDVESQFSNEIGKGYEFLFQKELRASDVSRLGRIVLPKKVAERYFPWLVVRKGIMIFLEDYHCGKFWMARYRFWPNNKSRMYLLENIGDFVNFHHLQEGDLLLCYRNERGYVIRGQKVPSNVQTPGKGLGSSGALAREVTPTSDTKIVTTEMPATHQVHFEEGKSAFGEHSANLGNPSFDSMYCTLGEIGDGKCFQDGNSRCLCQQTGCPTCGEDVPRTGFPASFKPLVHNCDFDPGVALLSVSNVKQRYMDDNQFLE